MKITKSEISALLKEDASFRDITTNSVIIQNKIHKFQVVSKHSTPFVLCGIEALSQALETVLAKHKVASSMNNGDLVNNGDIVISGESSIKELLQVERTVLNLIQHLSGISTKTKAFIDALDDRKIKVFDTRKTMPFLRKLQKYAVKVGGGENHRMDLSQMAMLKDNHIVAANGSIQNAVRLIKKHNPSIVIEVECDTLNQVEEASLCDVDIIMLDNMSIEIIKAASEIIKVHSTAKIEVSGGVTLHNISQYRGLNIDRISIGSLTHSVEAVDVSMEVI
jgi:nicotinate-nucleotide pyrophosphorylase (carboxylating)